MTQSSFWQLFKLKASLRSVKAQFAGCKAGIAAVEFALLAPIFFFSTLAVIDLSVFYAARSTVDSATIEAARVVKLGLIADRRVTSADVTSAACRPLFVVSCDDLSISVRPYAALPSTTNSNVQANGQLVDQAFSLGNPSDAVVVTIAYVHDFLTPFGSLYLSNSSLSEAGGTPVVSKIVVKNEPFPL